MKKIWNGVDVTPNVLPRDCGVCYGAYGGEFSALPCGHGVPESYPLHVGCVVRSLDAALEEEREPSCPICRSPIDDETLNRLADCIRRNQEVTFPGDDGTLQKERLWESEAEQKKLVDIMVRVREKIDPSHAEVQPEDGEYSEAHYRPLIEEAHELAQDIERGLAERAYTLEEMQEKQEQLDGLEDRLSVSAGKVAQYDALGWADAADEATAHLLPPSFSEIYTMLLNERESLEGTEARLRQEKEEMMRREEEERNHMHLAREHV